MPSGICKETGRGVGYKHGLRHHKVYGIWFDIKKRCYLKTCKGYKNYGGKGIVMYIDWISDFKSFYDYVTSLPNYDESNLGRSGLTLDRTNNNDNYKPGNLRWVDRHTQRANQGLRSNNKTGYSGVYTVKEKYHSKIRVRGETHYLGSFNNLKDAVKARDLFIIKNGLSEYPLSNLY